MIDIAKLKLDFGLDSEPWLDMDDNLLQIAVTKRGVNKDIGGTYGFVDYEVLEWLGDTVLNLIVSGAVFERIVLQKDKNNFDQLTQYRDQFVRNTTLYSQMYHKNLCQYLISKPKYKPKVKDIADVLESILGALYYHLSYIKHDTAAISKINAWYRQQFSLDKNIYISIKNKQLPYVSTCTNKMPITLASKLFTPVSNNLLYTSKIPPTQLPLQIIKRFPHLVSKTPQCPVQN